MQVCIYTQRYVLKMKSFSLPAATQIDLKPYRYEKNTLAAVFPSFPLLVLFLFHQLPFCPPLL